jgi:Legionella pneumophila major outer membrane protein precursor
MKALFLFSVPLILFAQQEQNQEPLLNPIDRFGTKESYNAYFTGEAVWFKPLNQEIIQKTPTHEAFFQNEFQMGLRLTFGVNTNYDGWDTYVSYTALRYSHTNPGFFTLNNSSIDADTKLNYDVNLCDFDLGRMFKVSKKLTLRPHLGARAFWLRQKQSLSDSKDVTYMKKIISNLAGIEGGLDTLWKFSSGFSLFGNVGLSSLVNSQKAKNEDLSVTYTQGLSSSIVGALDVSLGLRWDINFSQDLYHFAFIAGYEQHTYFNMNTLPSSTSLSSPFELLSCPDFSLQGISLGARFDF